MAEQDSGGTDRGSAAEKDPLNLKHNYIKTIRKKFPAFYEAMKANPGLYIADVKHDDWCDLLTGEGTFCNCDPDIRLKRF